MFWYHEKKLIQWKYILLNTKLFWLNENVFSDHMNFYFCDILATILSTWKRILDKPNVEAATGGFHKKVFTNLKMFKIHKKYLCWSLFFKKLHARTPFLQITSGRMLLEMKKQFHKSLPRKNCSVLKIWQNFLKTRYFSEHLWMCASRNISKKICLAMKAELQ